MNKSDIDLAADRLGYKLGWRFMMCPEAAMRTANVAIVGLNPGGHKHHGPTWSAEDGNAYWIESWGGQVAGMDPLQRQVQQIADKMNAGPQNVFAAQFVPFRSNSWSDLTSPRAAVDFARQLWKWTLSQSPARTIVCLGKVVGPEIAAIVGADLDQVTKAGWGDQTIEVYRSAADIKVVALPHLGRFKLMGRPVSEDAVLAALG